MCWATELEEPLSSGGWHPGCLLTAAWEPPAQLCSRRLPRRASGQCRGVCGSAAASPSASPYQTDPESSHGSACRAFPQANHSKKPGMLFSCKNIHLNPCCPARGRDFCLLVAPGIAPVLRGLRDEPGIAQSPSGPCLCSAGLCSAWWWWALPSPEVCTQGTLRWPQRGREAPPARVFPPGGPGGAAAP